MFDWLEKKLLPPRGKTNLPRTLSSRPSNHMPALIDPDKIDKVTSFLSPFIPPAGQGPADLPNATIIYACGAVALFVFALFRLFSGYWGIGLLLLLPSGALLGFALHYLRYRE